VRAQPSVHRKDPVPDNGGDGHAVEAVRESPPEPDVVTAPAFIIEAIDAVDTGALVIATEQKEVLGELDLVCEQETNRLERLPAAVDVVAQKEVILVRWEAT